MRIVLLHGYGGSANEMSAALASVAQWDGIELVALNGPDPCDFVRGRRQWFPLTTLPNILTPRVAAAAADVVHRIRGLENAAHATYFVGHSQGGMIAAYIALAGLLPGSASLCIASMAPFAERIEIDCDACLDFVHGTNDTLVDLKLLERHRATLAARGCPTTLTIVPDAGHALEGRLASTAASLLRQNCDFLRHRRVR